jgi:hypothetical protein
MDSYELGEPFVSLSGSGVAVGTPVAFAPRPGRLFPRDITAIVESVGGGVYSVDIEVCDKSDGSGTWSKIDTIAADGQSLVTYIGTVLAVRANATAVAGGTTVTVKFLAS